MNDLLEQGRERVSICKHIQVTTFQLEGVSVDLFLSLRCGPLRVGCITLGRPPAKVCPASLGGGIPLGGAPWAGGHHLGMGVFQVSGRGYPNLVLNSATGPKKRHSPRVSDASFWPVAPYQGIDQVRIFQLEVGNSLA